MSSPVPVPAVPAPFGRPAFLKLLRSAAVIATASIGLPASAQPLSRQQQQQEMQRSQLDDPSFRDLIPLIPERRVRRDERVPIFFPPNPPPLDRPVAHLVNAPGRLAAPLELTPYVNELFYPALGTRIHTTSLYRSQHLDLEAYRTAKVVLQNELRAVIDRHRESEPAVRRQALEEFARIQTPKVAELEKAAEDLRRDLVTGNISWTAQRQWHLVDREKRGFSPLEIAMVMRGYAYYHHALAAPQRRLLREIVMELLAAVEADGTPPVSAAQTHIFFSPEPARVAFPDTLPPEVATKLAAYQTIKSKLKKELYDRIHAYDGAAFGFIRSSLKSLVVEQEPQFEKLETLAEEIRRGLSEAPREEHKEEEAPLPPILAYRVGTVLRDRALAQRDATVKADAISGRRYDNDVRIRVAYRFDDNGMRVAVLPARNANVPAPANEAEVMAKVHAELAAVADEYGRRLAELVNEQDTIRHEAAELLNDPKRERVDAALITTNRMAVRKENEEAYRDYRLAVFEPGLSPEQRRLLFDRAIERLDLPLPRGEIQVTARAARW